MAQNDEQVTGPFQVFYDGKCPMCSALIDKVRHSAECDNFDLRDMHAQKLLPFDRDLVAKEIHLVDRNGRTYRGAQAIIKIANQYPRLRAFVAAGELPMIRPLLPVGYGLVAANRRFLFGPASRIFWLKVLIILVFCMGLILSARLWIGPRTYPVAPALHLLPRSIYPADFLLFGALFALAFAALASAKPQKFILSFLAIIVIFCLLDQSRLQPWVFQYGFLLAALASFSWESDDIAGRRRTLNIARLIVSATYVLSGVQKLNVNFINNDFPWIVEPIINVLPVLRAPSMRWGWPLLLSKSASGWGC